MDKCDFHRCNPTRMQVRSTSLECKTIKCMKYYDHALLTSPSVSFSPHGMYAHGSLRAFCRYRSFFFIRLFLSRSSVKHCAHKGNERRRACYDSYKDNSEAFRRPD